MITNVERGTEKHLNRQKKRTFKFVLTKLKSLNFFSSCYMWPHRTTTTTNIIPKFIIFRSYPIDCLVTFFCLQEKKTLKFGFERIFVNESIFKPKSDILYQSWNVLSSPTNTSHTRSTFKLTLWNSNAPNKKYTFNTHANSIPKRESFSFHNQWRTYLAPTPESVFWIFMLSIVHFFYWKLITLVEKQKCWMRNLLVLGRNAYKSIRIDNNFDAQILRKKILLRTFFFFFWSKRKS